MVVYWEYAFAENFLLDGLLLFLSLKCARAKVNPILLSIAAAVGGAEAVVFPLLPLPAWAAYFIKAAGGVLISVISVRKGNFKTHAVAAVSFFLLTFALGGALTAAYSFFGVEYEEGNVFLVERAPVALIAGGTAAFAIAVVYGIKFFYRYRKVKQNVFACTLVSGGKTVRWKGFADSGNLLTYRGEPVCVASAAAVFALFGGKPKAAGRMTVKTVNGGRDSPVFECERMGIETEKGLLVRERVYLTVGDVNSKEYQIILHTALTEVDNETVIGIEGMVGHDTLKRKRRKLSVRKRGAAAPAFGGRGSGNAEKTGRGERRGGG